MLDKYIYDGLHFIMKWSGQINSWAWRKHAKILRAKQRVDAENLTRDQENNAYLEELKRKL